MRQYVGPPLRSHRCVHPGLTNEVTILILFNPGIPHGLGVHVRVRLAHERHVGVVAVGDALKKVADLEQANDTTGMVDVGVGQKPRLDLGGVEVLQQLLELRARLNDVVQGQRIVDLGVVLERVDLVVPNQSFDGQAVVLVVLLVQPHRVVPRQRQVLCKVLVDQVGHEIVNLCA